MGTRDWTLGLPKFLGSKWQNSPNWTTSLMNYVIELLEMMGKCSIAFAHAKQPPVGWNSIFCNIGSYGDDISLKILK